MVRLPASVFVVTHFDRMAPLSQQTYMLGYGHRAVVSVCIYIPSVDAWERIKNKELYLKNNCIPDSHDLNFMFLCLPPDKIRLSISARFKRVGAEEHA